MAVLTTTFGTAVTLAVTALNSLANAAFWKSAAVNFSTNGAANVQLQVKLSTANTGAGSATGYFAVYLACSDDGTTYDGTVTGGDATWSTSAPPTAVSALGLQFLGRIPLNSTATTTVVLTRSFFLPIGSIPKYGVVVVENVSNKALLGSGNEVSYIENTYTIT